MKDGRVKYIHQICNNYFNEKKELIRSIGTTVDITSRKLAEKSITRFSRIFEESLNEIYLFDADTLKFVQLNNTALQNLGYTMEELMQMTPLDLKPESSCESFLELITPLLKGKKEKIVFETVHKRKDQSLYAVEGHLQLLKHDHDASLIVAICMDITERKKADQQLTFQASHDSLAGLINRREFEHRAQGLLATVDQTKHDHALCFMDLDQSR